MLRYDKNEKNVASKEKFKEVKKKEDVRQNK